MLAVNNHVMSSEQERGEKLSVLPKKKDFSNYSKKKKMREKINIDDPPPTRMTRETGWGDVR